MQPISATMRRHGHLYTRAYCEENAWHLTRDLLNAHSHNTQTRTGPATATTRSIFIVFASSPRKTILFLNHAGRDHVVWDYHVFVVEQNVEVERGDSRDSASVTALVYDLDANISGRGGTFPVDLQHYFGEVFPLMNAASATSMEEELGVPCFRVIPAATFLRHFASDRSHMRAVDGGWLSEPPEYACIVGEDGETMNLSRYLNMDNNDDDRDPESHVHDKYGRVFRGYHAFMEFMLGRGSELDKTR